MFDRYTEDARQTLTVAKEEAAKLSSPYIEAEHLLLGISRSSEPELKELLGLRAVEDALRAALGATAQLESSEKPANLPSQIQVRGFWPTLQKKLFGSTHGGLAPGICYSEFCVNPRVSPRVSWLLITLI